MFHTKLDYLGRLGGVLSHLKYFKLSLSVDTCQQLIR